MDIRKIKKLIELLEESDVEELEIQEGDDSVRISRRREPAAGGHYVTLCWSPSKSRARKMAFLVRPSFANLRPDRHLPQALSTDLYTSQPETPA